MLDPVKIPYHSGHGRKLGHGRNRGLRLPSWSVQMPSASSSISTIRRKPSSEKAVSVEEILIVEDEPEIAELIEFHLDREGLPNRTVHSGRLAIEAIRKNRPDLVVLDLMLPDVDGFEICRRLKSDPDTSTIPVIMVTAKTDDNDVVVGIELGADDYILKPFSPKVLVARIKSVLRRNNLQATTSVNDTKRLHLAEGRLLIDLEQHQVTVDSNPVSLTLTEFDLIKFLASRPGVARTRDQIISAVHGRDTVISSRTVDVHVTAIRRKLKDLGPRIETVRGVGYRFTEPTDPKA